MRKYSSPDNGIPASSEGYNVEVVSEGVSDTCVLLQ